MKRIASKLLGAAALAAIGFGPTLASAADLEVIHWWTSKGESAAVAEFAKALDNDGQGDKWIDSAIALGETARATVMQRVLGGDPPAAAQFNPGRQYEELIKGGKLLDLTDLATAGKWADVIRPKAMQSACLVDGHWWCVPVNIHSNYWAWYSKAAFANAGLPEPRSFAQFIADEPKLKASGVIPFAIGGDGNGWQIQLLFQDMVTEALGVAKRDEMYTKKSAEIAGGAEMKKVFADLRALKQYTDDGYANRNWNDTTNLVITNKAALQVMGDWARGEFAAAGMKGVTDFGCMIGLNEDKPVVSTDGDIMVFFKQDDPAVEAAQKRLADLLISPAVQVAFNNAKGSMPVRGDVDMSTADPCMQKALKAVEDPAKIVTATNRFITENTNQQINGLVAQYFADDTMTADAAAAKFAQIIGNSD
jgi:glucose/mannose transport system substrate-binding protein